MQSLIKQMLALLGFELRRKRKDTNIFDTQQLLCQNSHPVIFDVGANIGQTASEYRRRFPHSKIYAFEPFPECFQTLKQSYANDSNLIPLEMALSDHSGASMLFSNAASVTNSLLPTADDAESFWGDVVRTKNSISVKIETLSTFCHMHSIDHIDILKIDTQGSELSILRGAAHMLESKAIDLLYFEIILVPTYKNQMRIDKCFSFLYELGYRLVDIDNIWKRDNELLQMDVLFTGRQAAGR